MKQIVAILFNVKIRHLDYVSAMRAKSKRFSPSGRIGQKRGAKMRSTTSAARIFRIRVGLGFKSGYPPLP